MGTYQLDALQNIVGTGGVRGYTGAENSGAITSKASSTTQLPAGTNTPSYVVDFDASRVVRTSTETRSASTATAAVVLV